MEMHQVRYFLAVCETLNFTRAAENCNVSQPALTRAVHKLEEELGGLLLRRENNLTHLTDFGRLVRPHLEQMMTQAEAAKSTATQFLRMDSAPINLGVMCTVGPMRFMGFLAEFRMTHPGCEVTLIEGEPGLRLPRFSGRLVGLWVTSWSWWPACRLRRLSASGIPGPNAVARGYTNPRCS